MTALFDKIQEAVAAIHKKTNRVPKAGIILGTGLNALANEIKEQIVVPYNEIPYFPVATVEYHVGELVFGKLGDTPVVAMKGRFHYYEGYNCEQVTFPVRVMKALGIENLLISNASGGMNRAYNEGDLIIIEDHVNLTGRNPLVGLNDERLGPRWPDMINAYSKELIALAEKVAWENRILVRKGVYVGVLGPCLETRAEYRWLSTMADVVGMSTVPEVIVAVHSGLKVLTISVITDKCVPDTLQPVSIERIIHCAKEAEPKLTRLMQEIAAALSN